MLWMPYQQYVLTSKLSPQQIKEKFDEAGEEVDYTVRYSEKVIYIKEALNFRFGAHSRSFRPEATLTAIPGGQGYNYRITLKPRTSALLLLVFLVLAIIAGIALSKRNELMIGNYKDTVIVCICVLIMSYFLPVITFNADLAKLKLFIGDLLEVEQEN